MNPIHHMRWVSLLLCMALMLQGCSGVSYCYRENEGDRSALQIHPFWERSGDDKYLVGGLNVILTPLKLLNKSRSTAGDRREAVTTTEEPLLFTDLEPGIYRLLIYLNEITHVSETIELKEGKCLAVRVDVEGIKQRGGFFGSLEDIGEGMGEVVVVIGAVVVVIGVVALWIYADPDADFSPLFDNATHPGDHKDLPR